MSYSSQQLEALRAALASGSLTVEYGDRRITYRSISELQKAIQIVNEAVNPPPGGGPPVRRSFARFGKD